MKKIIFPAKRKIDAGFFAIATLFIGLSFAGCSNPTNSEVADENHIGFVGQGANRIEFRVENVADRVVVLTAFNAFRGTDSGATSLAVLESWGVTGTPFHTIIVTKAGTADVVVESNIDGILKGTINTGNANPFLNLIAAGYFETPIDMLKSTQDCLAARTASCANESIALKKYNLCLRLMIPKPNCF